MVDIVTYGMAKAYADKAVNGAVASVYTYKGRCTHAELAGKTKTAGDVWAMSDSGDTWQVGQEYCYDPAANQWVAMTGLRTTVINSLSSTSTHDALSAAQGKALNDAKADKTELAGKQDVLTAGENITIVNNVISATGGGGGGGGDAYTKAETDALLDDKQDVLTAGSGIVLNGSEISAGGYSAGEQRTNTPDASHSFPRFNITTDMKVFDTSTSQDNLCVIATHERNIYDPIRLILTLTYTHKGVTQTYTLSDYDNSAYTPLFISDTMYVSGYFESGRSNLSVYVEYVDYDTGELRRNYGWGGPTATYNISYFESDNGPGIQIQWNDSEEYICKAKCPSWASVPASDGNYTRFDESYVSSDLGGLYTNSQVPFAAYSASSYSWGNTYPLLLCSGLSFKTTPLVPHMQGTPGYVTGTSWGAPGSTPAPVTPPVSLPFIETITMEPPTPTYTDGDWGYDLDGDDAVIVCYTGSDTDITIPSTVGGHTVTAIGRGTEGAIIWEPPSGDVELTFTLPNTVTHINAYAFAEGCIVSNLPSGVTTIGDRAFYWTTTDFTIPASVVSIGIEAFGGYNDTEAYTVDAANPVYMSRDGVLFSKDGSKLIRFPPNSSVFNGEIYTIPETVTEIAASAFQDVYSPVWIVLPEKGPKIIGDSAFSYCESSLCPGQNTAFNIPSTVQYIGAYAFLNSHVGSNELILPESIISIGTQAFEGFSGSSGVRVPLVLPSTLQSIGEDAFDGTSINGGVFNYSQIDIMQGNTGLEDVDPSMVTTQPLTAIGYFAPIDVLAGDIAPYYSRFETDSMMSSKAPKAALPSGKTTSDTVTFQDLINMGIVIAPPSP